MMCMSSFLLQLSSALSSHTATGHCSEKKSVLFKGSTLSLQINLNCVKLVVEKQLV